jgi:hypothetical protein
VKKKIIASLFLCGDGVALTWSGMIVPAVFGWDRWIRAHLNALIVDQSLNIRFLYSFLKLENSCDVQLFTTTVAQSPFTYWVPPFV